MEVNAKQSMFKSLFKDIGRTPKYYPQKKVFKENFPTSHRLLRNMVIEMQIIALREIKTYSLRQKIIKKIEQDSKQC